MRYLLIIFLLTSCIDHVENKKKDVKNIHIIDSIFLESYKYKIKGNSVSSEKSFEYYNKAIDIYPNYDTVYHNIAVSKRELGDFQGAIDNYTKAIEINTEYSEAYYSRAINKKTIGDFQGAIDDYTKAIEVNPDFYNAYFNRASAKYSKGDIQGAIDDYTLLIKINPKYTKAYYNKAIDLGNMGKIEEAIKDYTKAIEINPEYVEAYYNRAMMYNRLGENDKALSDHLKAIEVSPRPLDKGATDMFASIGNIYYSKEEFAKAIDYYTQGLEVDPNDGELYYGRGLARKRLQDRDGACEDWHKALDLGIFAASVLLKTCEN